MSKRHRAQPVQVPGEAPTTTQEEGSEMGEGLDLDAVGDQAAAADQNGDMPQEEATESDVEAALEAGQAGGTHKIAKPKPSVPPAKLPRPDPTRSPTAGVNQRPTMSYAEAMELHAAGKLERSVLTEQGWVAVSKTPPAENKR